MKRFAVKEIQIGYIIISHIQ